MAATGGKKEFLYKLQVSLQCGRVNKCHKRCRSDLLLLGRIGCSQWAGFKLLPSTSKNVQKDVRKNNHTVNNKNFNKFGVHSKKRRPGKIRQITILQIVCSNCSEAKLQIDLNATWLRIRPIKCYILCTNLDRNTENVKHDATRSSASADGLLETVSTAAQQVVQQIHNKSK